MKKVIASVTVIGIFTFVIFSGLLSNVIAAGETREIARWTNLYDAPGGNPLAGIVLEPGTTVTELNRTRDGHWVLVQTDVGNGWVPATAITGASNPSTAPPAANPDSNAQITRWTNLYDSPGGSPLPNRALAPNTPVTVERFNDDGNWAFIRAEIGSGWVPANALNVRADNGTAPPAGQPAPGQPQPATPTQSGASPTITGVVIDSIDTHKALITLSYTGIPQDGYLPFFFVFDPDNCIVDCEDPDNALDYPIHGLKTITEGILPSGTIQIEVGLDNLYCAAEPFTRRLVAVVADARPLNAGQSTTADDLVEFPFEKQWCK